MILDRQEKISANSREKIEENDDTDFEDLFQFEEDLYKNKLRLSYSFLTYSIHFSELFLP